jgi:hypothetical protein
MKNKVILKSLQKELEILKNVKNTKNATPSISEVSKGGVVGAGPHNIKDSIIQRLYMRSSSFTLFLITGILGYAHKIPVVRHIITILD